MSSFVLAVCVCVCCRLCYIQKCVEFITSTYIGISCYMNCFDHRSSISLLYKDRQFNDESIIWMVKR